MQVRGGNWTCSLLSCQLWTDGDWTDRLAGNWELVTMCSLQKCSELTRTRVEKERLRIDKPYRDDDLQVVEPSNHHEVLTSLGGRFD